MEELKLKITVALVVLGILAMTTVAFMHYDKQEDDRIRLHSTI